MAIADGLSTIDQSKSIEIACPTPLGQIVISTSATEPRDASTTRSTGSTLGARVRSVHSPGAGEEPEVAGRRGRHLGGELTGPVEQPDVGVADRLARPR